MNVPKKDRIIIFLLPIAVFILVYLGLYYLFSGSTLTFNHSEGIENVKTILGIWGTILGFMMTAISILVTMGENKFLAAVKDSGHFATILYSYAYTCVHLLLAVIFAIILVFGNLWSKIFFILTCAFIADTLLMVAICLFFLFSIISKYN